MSRQAVLQYLEQVRTDDTLRARLSRNPTTQAYLEGGRKAGFEFSPNELLGILNAERFYLTAMDDAGLAAAIVRTTDDEAVVTLARERGFDCTAEDLRAVHAGAGTGAELSEAELDAVAGGFSSWPKIASVPAPPFGSVPVPYP